MHASVHLPQCRPPSYRSVQEKEDELKQVSEVSLMDLLHILSVYSYPEGTRLVISYWHWFMGLQNAEIQYSYARYIRITY